MLPLVAETPHRKEHIEEVSSLFGKSVFVTGWIVLVGDCLQYAMGDQLLEPVGEHVPRNLQVTLEVVEPSHSEEHVANYQQRPAVANDVDCVGDDTVKVFYGLLCRHARTISEWVA